jgi:hypothetical protein
MKEVTTAKLLLDKALNASCGQNCVDWALGMLEKGKESPNLLLLAGAVHPYNHFELAGWRDSAMNELGIESLDLDASISLYVSERLRAAIADSDEGLRTAIEEIKDLCLSTGHHCMIFDFYRLYFAYEDLKTDTFSYHLEGATRQNIMSKMRTTAEAFVQTHAGSIKSA